MTPSVSILMSVKDGAAFVAQAVEDILAQTMTDFEFIIVDDGSTDGTAAILDGCADPRIRRLTHDQARGLTASLNEALKVAQAPLLARMDADDRAAPGRLEKQVAFLRDNPEVVIVGTAMEVLDTRGEPVRIDRQPTEDVAIRWQSLFHNPFCHSSVVFRREALVRVEPAAYDESLPFAQDYDLWCRLLALGKGANLAEPLIGLRLHDQSVSSRNRTTQQQIADQVAARQVARLMGAEAPPEAEVGLLRKLYFAFPEELSAQEAEAAAKMFGILEAFRRSDPGREAFARQQTKNWADRMAASQGLGDLVGPLLRERPGLFGRAILRKLVAFAKGGRQFAL